MKKSSLFISAVLTTFVLAVLAGAFTAYRALARSNSQVNTQQPVAVVQPTASALTPEQAAQLAAQYLGRSDLYSVESAVLNGTTAFKVTFSSGDVVYVSPDGQVVSVVPAPPAVVQNSAPAAQYVQPVSPSHEDEHESGDD
jgi:hypothetical protein